MTADIWVRNAAVIITATFGLSACDAWYFHRTEIRGSSPAEIASVLREYSTKDHLQCSDRDQLPFQCLRQPIRVWAHATDDGVAVCYTAMGAQFENGKFKRRIERLDRMLIERFGTDRVYWPWPMGYCQSPQ